jgi:hypothetical protein
VQNYLNGIITTHFCCSHCDLCCLYWSVQVDSWLSCCCELWRLLCCCLYIGYGRIAFESWLAVSLYAMVLQRPRLEVLCGFLFLWPEVNRCVCVESLFNTCCLFQIPSAGAIPGHQPPPPPYPRSSGCMPVVPQHPVPIQYAAAPNVSNDDDLELDVFDWDKLL